MRWIVIVWLAIGLVLAQPNNVEKRWSPDQGRYAVAAPGQKIDKGKELERLIVYTEDGQQVAVAHVWQTESDGTERLIRGCEKWGWISSSKLFCEGSHNPSMGIYLVFDATTGSELYELIGSEFTWSPNGEFVAQSGNVPHFSDWATKSNSLDLGGKQIYPAEADQDIHRFRSELMWSPDSRFVAVVDHRKKGGIFLVLAPVRGSWIEHKLKWDEPLPDFPAPVDFQIEWAEDRVFVEHLSETQTFLVPTPARN